MTGDWNLEKIQSCIDNEIQESLSLEYKSAAALSKEGNKKTEITKDVSAMANSAGGVIVYGIKEFDSSDKKNYPEKLDPVDETIFSREQLQQVINNIQPRIEGIRIFPVQTGEDGKVLYVVEVPQSDTAHQAKDKKYYKRFNFNCEPMEDYEIRDIMYRAKHPCIEIELEIEIEEQEHTEQFPTYPYQKRKETEYMLRVRATNKGSILSEYVNVALMMPASFFPSYETKDSEIFKVYDQDYIKVIMKNTRRDVVEAGMFAAKKYGSSWFDPVLPGAHHSWEINFTKKYEEVPKTGTFILWTIFADNARTVEGKIPVEEIKILDKRKKEDILTQEQP